MPPEAPPARGTSLADVSVIVPAYRAEATIGRALISIARQTRLPREVIVVDDGSPDATYEAARALAPALGSVALVLLRQENRGAGAARNRALIEANGSYVAFLDADDAWLPEKLERSLARLDGTANVLVAHDGWIAAGGAPVLNACAKGFRTGRDPFVQLYRKGYIDTCSVVARRAAVVAAGGFDESLPNAQDFELWLAMVRAPGTRFEVFDEALVRYHPGPGGIMSHTDRRLACCLEIARRYAGDLGRRPGLALASVLYRVLAVHVEAVRAFAARGKVGRALAVLAWLPLRLAAALPWAWRAPAPSRPPLAGRA